MYDKIDKIVRTEILGATGLEHGVHPAWTADEDSGLCRGMIGLANGILGSNPLVTGEDVVMDIFAYVGEKPMLREVGRIVGRSNPEMFQRHPLAMLEEKQVLWKFVGRKARDHQTRETSRRKTLQRSRLDLTKTSPEVLLWDFVVSLLQTKTPFAVRLEATLRALAVQSALANIIIDKLVAGDDLGSVSGLAKREMNSSGAGGAVRWVKQKFAPAVAAFIEADEDIQRAYDAHLALLTR